MRQLILEYKRLGDATSQHLGGEHGLGSRVDGIKFRLAGHAINDRDLE